MKILLSILLSTILLTAVNIIINQNTWYPSDTIVIESMTRPISTTTYRIKDRWRELLEAR